MSSKKIALASPDSQKCQLPWTFVSREFMALLSNTKTPSQCRTFDCFRVSSGGQDGPGAECHRGHGPDGHRQHDGALGAPPLLHNQGHMIKTFTKTKTPENTFREHPQGAVTPPRPSVAFLAGIEWIRPVHSASCIS